MLQRILPFYAKHLERHPDSLLCKFLSCTGTVGTRIATRLRHY